MKIRNIFRCRKGQGVIELGLSLSLFLVLSLGVIEVSNMLHSYLVLTHLTREGANLTSRGTEPDVALDAIIKSACPTLQDGASCAPGNQEQWRVIYSLIAPEDMAGCLASPTTSNPSCNYVVKDQIVRGTLDPAGAGVVCSATGSKIGCEGNDASPADVYTDIGQGKSIYAIEVFYLHETVTPVANFGVQLPNMIYERATF